MNASEEKARRIAMILDSVVDDSDRFIAYALALCDEGYTNEVVHALLGLAIVYNDERTGGLLDEIEEKTTIKETFEDSDPKTWS